MQQPKSPAGVCLKHAALSKTAGVVPGHARVEPERKVSGYGDFGASLHQSRCQECLPPPVTRAPGSRPASGAVARDHTGWNHYHPPRQARVPESAVPRAATGAAQGGILYPDAGPAGGADRGPGDRRDSRHRDGQQLRNRDGAPLRGWQDPSVGYSALPPLLVGERTKRPRGARNRCLSLYNGGSFGREPPRGALRAFPSECAISRPGSHRQPVELAGCRRADWPAQKPPPKASTNFTRARTSW
jgi:hypothetical protein